MKIGVGAGWEKRRCRGGAAVGVMTKMLYYFVGFSDFSKVKKEII